MLEKAKGAVDIVIRQAELMSSNIVPIKSVDYRNSDSKWSMVAEETKFGSNQL